jgi:glycosyltransferase involved in cell wall biosynthesis
MSPAQLSLSEFPQTPIRMVVVSDRCSYALQLTQAIGSLPNVHCAFYSPKKPPTGIAKKIVQFKGFKNDKPVWTTYFYVFQILTQALRDKPEIIHFDFTVTIFGSSYLSCLPFPFLVLFLRFFGYRVVITVHDVITKVVLGEFFKGGTISKHAVWLGSIFFYKFLSFGSVFMVHLKIQKQMLTTMCYVNPKKVFVVPFGVADTPKIPKAILHSWTKKFNSTRIILFFGAIVPRKGIEYLIDGFSLIADKYPDSSLVIAGPADSKSIPYLNSLLEKANKQIGSQHFVYLGYLKEMDAHSLFRLCRVVCLPYVYTYASPSILYWAVQHHKPVIASRIGTLSDELIGYSPDLLVPPCNSKQIAWALEKILNEDDVAKTASRFMASKASLISWSMVAKNIHQIYLQCLSG